MSTPAAEQKPKTEEKPQEKSQAADAPDPMISSVLADDLGVEFVEGKVKRRLPDVSKFAKPQPKTDEKPKEEVKPAEPPTKPEEKPKTEEKPDVEVAPPEPPIEQTVETAVEKVLDRRMPKPPLPTKEEKKPEPPVDPDAGYIASLDEDSRYEVELAQYAEKHDPEKFKGRSKAVIGYLRAIDDYIAKHKSEEDRTFDESDKDFQDFLGKHRPKISNAERRKLEIAMATDQASEKAYERARNEFAPRIQEANERQTAIEVRPKIEKLVGEFSKMVLDLKTDDPQLKEAVTAVREKGAAALNDDPVFAPIVLAQSGAAQEAAAEFLAISHSAIKFDPDGKPLHRWIYDYVEQQGRVIESDPKYSRQKAADGRVLQFAPRSKFSTMTAEQRANHWTFSDDNILELFAINGQRCIEAEAKKVSEKLQKGGYSRAKPKAEAVVPSTPPPSGSANPANQPANKEEDAPVSPKTGGGVAPGAGDSQNKALNGESFLTDKELSAILGHT